MLLLVYVVLILSVLLTAGGALLVALGRKRQDAEMSKAGRGALVSGILGVTTVLIVAGARLFH